MLPNSPTAQSYSKFNQSLEKMGKELQYLCHALRRGQFRENFISTPPHQVTWTSVESKWLNQSPKTLTVPHPVSPGVNFKKECS